MALKIISKDRVIKTKQVLCANLILSFKNAIPECGVFLRGGRGRPLAAVFLSRRVLRARLETRRKLLYLQRVLADHLLRQNVLLRSLLCARQVEHTFNEKNILFCMDNNFIVKMTDYFQDKLNLYMCLEFVNGGEMFTHIQQQKNRRFNWEQTRFFAAETVLAFECVALRCKL